MFKKTLSGILSAMVVFYIGTASASQKFNDRMLPAVLLDSEAELLTKYIDNPAAERFEIAQSIEEISNPAVLQKPAYSEDDLYWLSRIIEAEASGESYMGKLAVGNCVLNRVNSTEFPNTIYGVIFDTRYGVQYQPTANGAIYNTPSADSVNAAKEALEGISVVGDAMYFCATSVAPNSWMSQNRPYFSTIGNHVFYL